MNTPAIFDHHAIRLRRDRAVAKQALVSPILEAATAILSDRLDDVARSFTAALDIGGRGLVSQMLAERHIPTLSMDISARQAALSAPYGVCASPECLPFAPESFDLVVACLSLHWVNDLPGTFMQIRRSLRPDGLFLACIPILPTLRPLRTALERAELALSDGVSPRVSPLPTQQGCVQLLQRAGFALPVVDSERLDLRYRSTSALLADLRAAGETSALMERPRRFTSRMLFAAAAAELESEGPHATAHDANNSEGFPMPLHMAVLSGWAPAPTQPQPLQPGQFQHDLRDVLSDAKPTNESTDHSA
ncbi:MAG: methyltransferase domain-containing protein [Acetobacter peroxydans]|jgi:SAM-dependent methyltransferase|nr:methyltransferase domain-containing protein [Acetobacter peroxydans]MCI2079082.1 methyltransferase domain-containing protein [Acetobacter peroxydans]